MSICAITAAGGFSRRLAAFDNIAQAEANGVFPQCTLHVTSPKSKHNQEKYEQVGAGTP
jgi:hypothetical protein